MPINFTCPHCGKQMSVADNFAGQTGPCSACGQSITIPRPMGFGTPPRKSGGNGLMIGLAIFGVVALVGCGGLMLLLIPAVGASRQAAQRMQSMNHLKQIGLAMHNYHDTYNALPPAVVKDANGTPLYSGRVLLLPFMEQAALFNQFDKSKAWNSPENQALSQTIVPTFLDPVNTAGSPARSDYLLVTGPGTIGEQDVKLRFADVTDGLSNTLFAIETKGAGTSWAEPTELDIQQVSGGLPTGNHRNGNLALFADGSVQFLSDATPAATIHAALTRNGGEVVNLP